MISRETLTTFEGVNILEMPRNYDPGARETALLAAIMAEWGMISC